MEKENPISYRTFKVSISILFFGGYYDTTVHKIKNNFTLVLFAGWYTLLTILFGWWGRHLFNNFQGITDSIEAIKINLSGGIEFTGEKEDFDYDERTISIWHNLLRKTTQNISKQDLEIIIEIQEEYETLEKQKYSYENIEFIFLSLDTIKIKHVTKEDLVDVFHSMEIYNKQIAQ